MLRPRKILFPSPWPAAGTDDGRAPHGADAAADQDAHRLLALEVTILESSEMNRAMAQSYCGHLWPSSLAVGLALCRWHTELVSDKVILELGAGTALPSTLACTLTNTRIAPGPRRVIATDMTLSSMPPLNRIHTHNPTINDSLLSVHAMPWGVVEAVYGVLDEAQVEAVDVVLAADCLFHHDVYDQVLATFSSIVSAGAGEGRAPPVLVVGYQRRSSSHSIVPLLKQWDLKVTRASKATQLADCFVERECSDRDSEDDSSQAGGACEWSEVYERDPSWNMSGFDSVDVLFIEPR